MTYWIIYKLLNSKVIYFSTRIKYELKRNVEVNVVIYGQEDGGKII